MPNWIPLTDLHEIEHILARSREVPCLIFKHSTRCNVSAIAKYRLDDDWNFTAEQIEPYLLDLLAFRQVSNTVAETFQVYHESPQVLLIVHGECTYDASHLDVSVDELREALALAANG